MCYRRLLECVWNLMAHGDAQEGKWRGNWWMEWVASTLHTTSEHGVSSITTADAHTLAASSQLNWRPRRFKWLVRFGERQNLVSARAPSRFKRSLLNRNGPHLYTDQTSPTFSCPSALSLPSYLSLGLSSGLFMPGFLTKLVYTFLTSPTWYVLCMCHQDNTTENVWTMMLLIM